MKNQTKWTLVQHSGAATHAEFEQAVELTSVNTAADEARVRKVGGKIYDTYEEANKAEEHKNYPPEVRGIVPRARGSFSPKMVNDLKIYIPRS